MNNMFSAVLMVLFSISSVSSAFASEKPIKIICGLVVDAVSDPGKRGSGKWTHYLTLQQVRYGKIENDQVILDERDSENQVLTLNQPSVDFVFGDVFAEAKERKFFLCIGYPHKKKTKGVRFPYEMGAAPNLHQAAYDLETHRQFK